MENKARSDLAEMNDSIKGMPNNENKALAAILIYIAATLEEIRYEITHNREI